MIKGLKRWHFWLIPLLAAPSMLLVVVASGTTLKLNLSDSWPRLRKNSSNREMTVTQSPSLPQPKPTIKNHQTHQVNKPVQKATVPQDVEMKIAIAINADIVPVATSTTGIIKNDAGHALRSLPPQIGYYPQAAGNKIDFGSWKSPGSIVIEAKDGGLVAVGERWYRGKVRLISRGNSLLAVNHVHLEPYLSSVVGSEMFSHWPLEALKAQAVAARSYALVRKNESANPFYDLGATEAWQVYKGVHSEASTTHTAVQQTAGQILVSKGEIVDAMYADTDETSRKAHDGKGMSQTGAMLYAKQGSDYLHILGTYYPGSSLTRLNFQ